MQSVYLVEDSPLVLERLKQLLAPLKNTSIVGSASGVNEAIAGIRASKPDVVVLDLSLTPGSGFDVLTTLKGESDFYVLSNFASEPYRRHAHRLGAAGFFDKTNDFERVRDVIAQRALTH